MSLAAFATSIWFRAICSDVNEATTLRGRGTKDPRDQGQASRHLILNSRWGLAIYWQAQCFLLEYLHSMQSVSATSTSWLLADQSELTDAVFLLYWNWKNSSPIHGRCTHTLQSVMSYLLVAFAISNWYMISADHDHHLSFSRCLQTQTGGKKAVGFHQTNLTKTAPQS